MDTPETFAAALLASSAIAVVGARAVVQKGAQNIKTEWRNNALQSAPTRHARAPYAITYDVDTGPTSTTAEIGYDKDMPGGSLGNLLEYGGGGDHSPPHRDGGRALDAEDLRFVKALSAVARGLL